MRSPTFHIIGDAFVDLFAYLNGAWPKEPGRDNRMSSPMAPVAGGSAVNTATHLQSLCSGFVSSESEDRPEVVLFTVLNPNDDYGKALLRHAEHHGLALLNCRKDDETSSTAHCVVVVTGSERSFLSYHGAVEQFSASDLPTESIVAAEGPLYLLVAGYFNLRAFWNGNLRDRLVQIRQERTKRGAKTTISLVTQFDGTDQWDGGLDDLLSCLDFLILNETEARHLRSKRITTGAIPNDPKSSDVDVFEQLVKYFATLAPRLCIVITKGADGAMAFRNGQTLATQSSVSVDVVDTTGAGDGFAAGFLYGISDWRREHNEDGTGDKENDWPVDAVKQGLWYGCASGTAVVRIRGASVPAKTDDIKSLLDQLSKE